MAEEAEWEKLFSLYEAFPVSELIIHPRLRKITIREESVKKHLQRLTEKSARSTNSLRCSCVTMEIL